MIVKLTKLNGKPDASIQVGYWVKGIESLRPELDKPYQLWGGIVTSRNEPFAWFSTTPLAEIEGDLLITQNSTWKREVL